MEIYNEQVLDLLDSNPRRRPLPVRMQADRGFHVGNLFVIECQTEDDMLAVLDEGLLQRRTTSHGLNERSSRSHTILTVHIESQVHEATTRGSVAFVDLAGSERQKATGVSNQSNQIALTTPVALAAAV